MAKRHARRRQGGKLFTCLNAEVFELVLDGIVRRGIGSRRIGGGRISGRCSPRSAGLVRQVDLLSVPQDCDRQVGLEALLNHHRLGGFGVVDRDLADLHAVDLGDDVTLLKTVNLREPPARDDTDHFKPVEVAAAQELAKKLEGSSVKIARAAGDEGKMFGSVTTKDIGDAFEKIGVTIDRKKIQLPEPIKQLGTFEVPLKLHGSVSVTLKVEVIKK